MSKTYIHICGSVGRLSLFGTMVQLPRIPGMEIEGTSWEDGQAIEGAVRTTQGMKINPPPAIEISWCCVCAA